MLSNHHAAATILLDWFPRSWGWHYENTLYPPASPRFYEKREIAFHVGPLLVTITTPPERA